MDIKKLAEALNLSKSTVSRAFRGNSDISKATKERILAMARELHFEPNHHASNLRDRKSKTIAVIVPEIANNFFSQAINGIEKVARKEGYHILIYLTDDDFNKEVSFITHLQNGRADGIIMSVSGEANDHNYLNKLRKKRMPLVFFDRIYEDIETSHVTTNDYESSFLATEHLIKAGCTKIAYLVINKNLSIGKMRWLGYADAIRQNGFSYDDDLVIECTNDQKKNIALLKKKFKQVKPDGVFASVERLAFASYYASYELGIRIPGQMKVISFSSLEILPLLNPSLSTVTQPAFDMGVRAAELLFKVLEKEDDEAQELQHIVLKSTLVARDSTAVKPAV